MQVNGIGMPAAAQPQAGQAAGKAETDLNINDFFKLISAQLQNQSMFDTVDNTQFMTQMVQFSTLSQISQLSSAFQSNMAVTLIGKQVSVASTGENGAQQMTVGQVEQVSFSGGVPYILVNGEFHQLSEIMDVGPAVPEAPAE